MVVQSIRSVNLSKFWQKTYCLTTCFTSHWGMCGSLIPHLDRPQPWNAFFMKHQNVVTKFIKSLFAVSVVWKQDKIHCLFKVKGGNMCGLFTKRWDDYTSFTFLLLHNIQTNQARFPFGYFQNASDKRTYHHHGSKSHCPLWSHCNLTIYRKPASDSCSL